MLPKPCTDRVIAAILTHTAHLNLKRETSFRTIGARLKDKVPEHGLLKYQGVLLWINGNCTKSVTMYTLIYFMDDC